MVILFLIVEPGYEVLNDKQKLIFDVVRVTNHEDA